MGLTGRRLVWRRLRAQGVVMVAAVLTLLLGATTMCATAMYASSVTESGLQAALRRAPITERGMEVSTNLTREDPADQDAEIRGALNEAFVVPGAEIYASLVSESYSLRLLPTVERSSATVVSALEDLPGHAALVAGRWPVAAGDRVEVVLPAPAAELMGVAPGDPLPLVLSRRSQELSAEVVGTFIAHEPASAYWFGDSLLVADGVDAGDRFSTYGPLVTVPETFLGQLREGATARWRVIPQFADLSVAEVSSLRNGLGVLGTPGALPNNADVESGLLDLLNQLGAPLLVARSSVYLPAALLVLLASYALVLIANLLTEHRAAEVRLFRARGLSPRQLTGYGGREAALLALPAAVLAPVLATLFLRWLDDRGPLAGVGLRLGGGWNGSSWFVAGMTAALGAVALTWPTIRAALTGGKQRPLRGPPSRRSGFQQAGGDLVLLVVAALACWQLARYGSPLVAGVGGGPAVDPLLVLAPALALVAGAVLALRFLPLLTGRAERVLAHRAGLTATLGAWQVNRRPRRYAGPALLLVMALAVGALSLTYARAWSDSQQDQADFVAGADIRLESPSLAGSTIGRAATYAELPEVQTVMPVDRGRARVGQAPAALLAVDAGTAEDVLTLRPDLADRPLGELLLPLAEGRPEPATVALPEPAAKLVVVTEASTDRGTFNVDLSLVLQDGLGLLHRVSLGEVATDGTRREVAVDLNGLSVAAAEPVRRLSVLALEAAFRAPSPADAGTVPLPTLTLAVTELRAVPAAGGPATALSLPNGMRWHAATVAGPIRLPKVLRADAGDSSFLTLVTTTGASDSLVRMTVRPRASSASAGRAVINPSALLSLPVLLTRGLASEEVPVGDEAVAATIGGLDADLQVAGLLDAVPGVPEGEGVVVVDLPTLALAVYDRSGRVTGAEEWWLQVRDGRAAAAVSVLDANQELAKDVVDRGALAEELRTDPIGVGIIGALVMGFAAALAFAAIGFIVNAAVSARERMTEFALLRAIGASSRQLRQALGAEQACLLGLGVSVGLVLGTVVAYFVVPVVALDADATRPFPSVVVTVPWLGVAALIAGVTVLFGMLLLALGWVLSRTGLGGTLRLGDTT